ncbi:helix-turn-helix domain-containing protein [Nocardia sp. CNY236]|uniref:helix-turn-helix domain-containing protein n=1 Tax=Nocardia sp. CNY236 TaxID=1169152 RepID=UPI0012DCF9E3
MRVDKLEALLAQRTYTTAADLAAELGVSTRTLHRDLQVLSNPRPAGVAHRIPPAASRPLPGCW